MWNLETREGRKKGGKEGRKEGRRSRKEQISPIEGLETCCSRAGEGFVVEKG